MSNTYRFNVLTIDGAALIAQATAANPIVYVGALSKATAAASATELTTAPASWYTGKPGEIVAVSATGNVAEIRAVWRNAGQSQLAKSVAVTARLASQSDAQAVVITAMSDPGATVVLPGSTDTGAGVAIPFYVQIGATDSVEVTPGACASIADLARFVSIHSAGNPNAGDAQTVRGEKTFADPVTLSATIAPNASGVNLGAADSKFSHAYVSGTSYLSGGVVSEYAYETALGNFSASYGPGGAYWTNDMGLGRFDVDPEFTSGGSTLRVLYNTSASGAVATSTTVVEIGSSDVTLPAATLSVGGGVSTGGNFICRNSINDFGLFALDRAQFYDGTTQHSFDLRTSFDEQVGDGMWFSHDDGDPILGIEPGKVSVFGGFASPMPDYDSSTSATSVPLGGLALAVLATSTGAVSMKCGQTLVWDPATAVNITLSIGKATTTLGLSAGQTMPAGSYKFLNEAEATSQVSAFALVIRVA